MHPRRYFGVALIVLAVAAAAGLDAVGRDHQPRSYRVDFIRGTEPATGMDRRIEHIAAAMARQPGYQAVLVGHTGTRGDAGANQQLGLDRARAVARALREAGVAADRLEAHSVGGSEPLSRRDGEGERGYQSRLSRVEVRLNP